MGYKTSRILIALVMVAALLLSACAAAATPTPTAQPKAPAEKAPAAAPTTAPRVEPTATAAAKPATPAAQAAPKVPVGDPPRSITLATSSPGTTLYAMGTGLSKVASDVGPMQVIVQPFAGAPAYIPQMSSTGKPETSVLNSVEAWQALTGKITPKPLPEEMAIPAPYKQAYGNLRALMMGTDLTVGWLVRKDSRYQTPTDLKGARVGWGHKAHGGAALAHYTNVVLAGISAKDVTTVDVPDPTAAVRLLGEGRIDAAVVAVGMGAIAEVDAQVGLRFLDAPRNSPTLKAAQGMMPGGRVVTLKAGSSAAVVKDTDLWGYPTVVLTSSNLSDIAAYSAIKVWWENYQKLESIAAPLQGFKPEIWVSKSATVPYHPAAIAFYQGKGVWTADMDASQQLLLKGELPGLQ